jgi:hypothetical protein
MVDAHVTLPSGLILLFQAPRIDQPLTWGSLLFNNRKSHTEYGVLISLIAPVLRHPHTRELYCNNFVSTHLRNSLALSSHLDAEQLLRQSRK